MLCVDDRKLLRLWQDEPTLSPSELSERAGLTAARGARRIERMRDAGIFRGRRAIIDWKALGYTVQVSLRVQIDKAQPNAFDAFMDAARTVPEVVEIQTFMGRVDVRLSVLARDMADYRRLWHESILTLPHISEIEGLMTVTTLKDDVSLPL